MSASPDPDRTSLLREALGRIGEKWTPLLLGALAEGPRRYSDLHHTLGVSPKVLTAALRALERDGFIARFESISLSVQVCYQLTALGRSLLDLVNSIERWAEQYAPEVRRARQSKPYAVDRGAPPRRPHLLASQKPVLQASPTHLCVAVRDIERAAAAFSTVFGVTRGPINGGPVTGPHQSTGAIKQCSIRLQNFAIEFIEPVRGTTPFRDFLERSGEGLQHIGMRVHGSLEDQKALLASRGGTLTLGGQPENGWALFDFTERLGSTVELLRPRVDKKSAWRPQLFGPDALANHPVSYIGILVHDVAEAAREYAAVLGVGVSPIRTVNPVFPRGSRAATNNRARIVSLWLGGVPLVLIEPVGSSPWGEFVEAHGSAIHHVSFNVRGRLNQVLRALQDKGGGCVLGGPDVGYAHVDFTAQLGLTIGLVDTGTTATAQRRSTLPRQVSAQRL